MDGVNFKNLMPPNGGTEIPASFTDTHINAFKSNPIAAQYFLSRGAESTADIDRQRNYHANIGNPYGVQRQGFMGSASMGESGAKQIGRDMLEGGRLRQSVQQQFSPEYIKSYLDRSKVFEAKNLVAQSGLISKANVPKDMTGIDYSNVTDPEMLGAIKQMNYMDAQLGAAEQRTAIKNNANKLTEDNNRIRDIRTNQVLQNASFQNDHVGNYFSRLASR